jgi:hypothetical protein
VKRTDECRFRPAAQTFWTESKQGTVKKAAGFGGRKTERREMIPRSRQARLIQKKHV